jgi:hydroxymethylbilane synthase
MRKKIIIGSRQSELALIQAHEVMRQLEALGLHYDFEIKKMITKGDRILDVTLSKVGGKGLFVKEIEQALLDREIDIAVHSMKDMPGVLPDGLVIGAITKREDVRDAFVSKNGIRLQDLPAGSIIGTSSLRREAQIKAYRPDLEIRPIRGNLNTRMRKLSEEDFDGIILAVAGLHRMGMLDKVTDFLPIDVSLPAVGQGALGIECREKDQEALSLIANLDDPATGLAVKAERAFLKVLEGGCQVPIAAYAQVDSRENSIHLTGLVATPDGKTILKNEIRGADAEDIGIKLARSLLSQGAQELLDKVKEEYL